MIGFYWYFPFAPLFLDKLRWGRSVSEVLAGHRLEGLLPSVVIFVLILSDSSVHHRILLASSGIHRAESWTVQTLKSSIGFKHSSVESAPEMCGALRRVQNLQSHVIEGPVRKDRSFNIML